MSDGGTTRPTASLVSCDALRAAVLRLHSNDAVHVGRLPEGMRESARSIDRREALRRAALLLGGVISAPTIAAVLAGCEAPSADGERWSPRALTREQGDLVAAIADQIIPRTDTPGARDVGVHRFIDTMLAEYYSAEERSRFLAGLAAVDSSAQRASGQSFVHLSAMGQRDILTPFDADAHDDAARHPFFRTMKELTLLGYYTSEAGATRELKFARVPGRFDGCVPFATVGRAWSV